MLLSATAITACLDKFNSFIGNSTFSGYQNTRSHKTFNST